MGVAVKVTPVPEQIVVAEAAILTDGVTAEVIVMVIALDVAAAGFAQVTEDVITTFTTSLLFNEDDEKVLLFVPALLPFTFH